MSRPVFRGLTLVDCRKPVPVAWLQKAGIQYVYTSAVLDLAATSTGKPCVPAAVRLGWRKLEDAYEGAGIKVLIMSNYYTRHPEGTDAVDVSGAKIKMACLYNDMFYQWMHEIIIAQAEAYSEFSVFGGFVFDDGWGTRVDCCYCEECRGRFREMHGKQPPPFEVHEGTGVVADQDVLLQWDAFQRAAYERYVDVQAAAVRSVSDDLMMLTIPSDSFFYGRLLNANLAREELPAKASALLQRIERLQVKNWFLYQSFPLPRLPEKNEKGLQHWGVGAHFTANSPKLVLSTEGPFIQHSARLQMMSAAEIEQMARITVTEGADTLCYWAAGAYTAYHPDGYDGMADVYADVQKLGSSWQGRTPFPTHVGLLYSTTTEVLEQPWRQNLSERWLHLHSFEAMAWSLLRGNIWSRTIMEDEINSGALSELSVLLVPSVRFLTESNRLAIQDCIEQGLRVLCLGECVDIPGAELVDCDVTFWHRCIQTGYRQRANLDAQYEELERQLLPKLRKHLDYPIKVSTALGISKLYRSGNALLLFIANWDLHAATEAIVTGLEAYEVRDALSGKIVHVDNGVGRVIVTVPAAGWRVLRLVPVCDHE